jgi:ligand-binding sensor domain-containing protein/serine phosphatase RsbU (regulator of sigma subunit)
MGLTENNLHTACVGRKGLFMILLSVLTCHAFSQSYDFRTFDLEDGLAQSYIYSIVQDERGYLWVATGNGLSRYNGFAFENFTTSDSLADNFITCGISAGENLWFGHMNGQISFFDGNFFDTVHTPQSDLSPITHFAKSPQGHVWVSTYSDGLMKLNEDTGVEKHTRFVEETVVITFEFIDDKELLIGTNAGLFYGKLNDTDEIELLQPVSGIPESRVTGIQKIRKKPGYYIATEDDGIFQLTTENIAFKVSKIITEADEDFAGIQKIYEDNQSDLWLCTRGNGTGLIKLSYSAADKVGEITYFNKSNRFITDDVNTIFEDYEGNIWSGNYGAGLTQIKPKTFSVYRFENPLYGNNIFSFYVNARNKWAGTENGLVKMDHLSGDVVKFYGKVIGLPKDTVTSLYSPNGKVLWIGTGKNGVFQLDVETDKIRKFPVGAGMLENAITAITGEGEQVWIGTKKGLIHVNSATQKVRWYSISQGGLPHNFINGLYLDSKERLWLSSPNSTLAYIENEKVFKIPFSSVSGILAITEDADSRIWVGSNGNGVFMLDTDSIANVTVKDGLLSNYCYSLVCDKNKNIWVGHKDGLSKIRVSDFSVKPVPHITSTTDNYQFNPNAILKEPGGKLWFGTHKGMVSYDPSKENSQLRPPVLGITSVKVNDEEIDYTDKIILPPGNYKIRIDFLGISLKEPSLVNYQFKLDGYDQWSEITKSTFVTYSLISQGEYTFMLKAGSGDGIFSERPLNLGIVVKVPVYGKWWFYPSLLLLLIILTLIYIKWRTYIFLAEKKALEKKVQERTHEIQLQKNELELQRDIIEKKNASITSSITYASYIQNAVFPPVDLINKLLPDSFILNKPKDIVSGDFYWLAERDGKIVIVLADCTGHGVPGAFMSLLGITLLNEIVNFDGITQSDAIVTMLRERVTNSLQQGRENSHTSDGLDIALCVLDVHQGTIQFTGGMHNIVLIRDKELTEFKADRFSVYALSKSSAPFSKQDIEYTKGDVIYLFSDGYQDQFGGDFDKKFLRTHFYRALLELHDLPMVKQKEILENNLNEWMKDEIQTDDITVMGIRL